MYLLNQYFHLWIKHISCISPLLVSLNKLYSSVSVSDMQHIPQSLWWQLSHHFDHELSLEVSPCTCALIVYRQLRECHYSSYNSLLNKVLVFSFPINIELKFSGLYTFLQILVHSIKKEISLALLSGTICNKFTEIGVVPILNPWKWEEN